jgi:NAD(P)-dependent dehydrogenase (short-subunit alcohol dehydrogenase family)
VSGTPTTAAGLDPLAAFRLDGKVAIVTGASSGLGARFARVLDAAGAKVVLLARRRERLEQLAGELREALPVGCDLTVTADIDRAMEAAIERFGRVDVLVNNAGAVDVAPALEEPLEQFQDVIAVNLVAPFALSQRAARAMLEHGDGGTIVNVASILGLVGVGQIPQAGYAASKGGIVNLTRELAAQWARSGIRVNAIAPGWFESEMTEHMFAEESGHKWVARRAPMGRHGREGELDGALLFLAGDASSYVTGQVLAVDGGWTSV